jgi:hypothetical protein
MHQERLPILDSFIAATALNNGFTIVTRNTKDFTDFGDEVFSARFDPLGSKLRDNISIERHFFSHE